MLSAVTEGFELPTGLVVPAGHASLLLTYDGNVFPFGDICMGKANATVSDDNEQLFAEHHPVGELV